MGNDFLGVVLSHEHFANGLYKNFFLLKKYLTTPFKAKRIPRQRLLHLTGFEVKRTTFLLVLQPAIDS